MKGQRNQEPGDREQGPEDRDQENEQLLLTVTVQGPYTQQEIADLLGLKRPTVAFHEYKALEKLRRAIEQDKELYDFFREYLGQPRPRQNFCKVMKEMTR